MIVDVPIRPGWLVLIRFASVMAWVALSCPPPAAGAPSAANQDNLESLHESPWFDAEHNEVQAVPLDSSDSDAANRGSSWEATYRSKKNGRSRWDGSWISMILQGLAWVLMISLVIVLVMVLIWAFLRRDNLSAAAVGNRSSRDRSAMANRIEQLPFDLAQPQHDLLTEARQSYERGDFRRAIVYLFSHQLLFLDSHHLIRLTKGKTNRTYLWEIRKQAELARLLENTMITFEDVFFGDYPLERESFETCWRQIDRFHQLCEVAS